jgi:hypothetical protein
MFLHFVLLLHILYSVLLIYYCLRIVHFYVTLPPGIGPTAVRNIYIYHEFVVSNLDHTYIIVLTAPTNRYPEPDLSSLQRLIFSF